MASRQYSGRNLLPAPLSPVEVLTRRGQRFGGVPVTALVVLAVLVLTGVSAGLIHRSNVLSDRQHFESLRESLRGEMVRRVERYRQGLVGVRSLFTASRRVDRAEFRQMALTMDLTRNFPAATGVGFIQRVPVTGLTDFLADARADGAADFKVRMLADEVTHDDLLVIKYIEPEAANAAAVGLDIGQEARRRAAAQRALRSNRVSLTEQITLVQATGSGPGFLILLPIFEPGLPVSTPSQREVAIRGWAYMTLLAERVFAGTEDRIGGQLSLKVFDNTDRAEGAVLYESSDHVGDSDGLDRVVPISLGGRRWIVEINPTPRFSATSRSGFWTALGGGLTLTAMLALLLRSQTSSLRRARELARAMTADLRHAAHTDRLTGLPNRMALLEKLEDAIHRAHRVEGYHYAVLFLDFDRFKIINDSLGHAAGDTLLCEISARLRGALRPHDKAAIASGQWSSAEAGAGSNAFGGDRTAARLGGDEFVVLLDGLTTPGDAGIVARRLLEKLAEPYVIDGHEVVSTASIGLVRGDRAYTTADAVIRDADVAMYEAKEGGRGCCVIFDEAMRIRVAERLQVETDLRGAVSRGEFFLQYQPILCLHTGRVVSCEALVRWRHPRRGVLGPDRFIPLAEEIGVIEDLGLWVLHEALGQLARWRSPGLGANLEIACPSVSVNLSPRQLDSDALFDQVTGALDLYGVEPGRLHLEVTESHVMRDPEAATAKLRRLREAGVKIDMDDFGTGHSSLACLHAFPIDVVKLDRAFIANVEHDGSLIAVTRTVIDLCRTLNVSVVAEGIETPEQVKLMQSVDCGLGQGYFFARPLDAGDVVEACRRFHDDLGPPNLRLAG